MGSESDSDDDRNLLSGFSAWEGTAQRDVVEEIHDRDKRDSIQRVKEFAR